MFGKKEKLQDELTRNKDRVEELEFKLNRSYQNVTDVRVELDQVEISAKGMDDGLDRVVTDIKTIGQMQEALGRELQTLSGQIEEKKGSVKSLKDDYDQTAKDVNELSDKAKKLMEGSKHYTGIAKKLSTAVEGFQEENNGVLLETGKMSELASNMGTLALNAAIEAGRMGEGSMKFVKAADEVRSFAEEYEKSANAAEEHAKNLQANFGETAADIQKLIGLLKDNNILLQKIADSAEQMNHFLEENKHGHAASGFVDMSEQMTKIQDASEESVEMKRVILEEMEKVGQSYMEAYESFKKIAVKIEEIKSDNS